MKRNTYYGADAAGALAKREGTGSFSGTVNTIIIRYDQMCTAALPDLEEGEWNLIYDVLNGAHLLPEMSLRGQLLAEVSDGIEINGLDAKWEVDGPTLIERIARLRLDQLVAVHDAALQFWARADEPLSGDPRGWPAPP